MRDPWSSSSSSSSQDGSRVTCSYSALNGSSTTCNRFLLCVQRALPCFDFLSILYTSIAFLSFSDYSTPYSLFISFSEHCRPAVGNLFARVVSLSSPGRNFPCGHPVDCRLSAILFLIAAHLSQVRNNTTSSILRVASLSLSSTCVRYTTTIPW